MLAYIYNDSKASFYFFLFFFFFFFFFLNRVFYEKHFGAVLGLTRVQMETVNGFSNVYWGWGKEDDDMYQRTRHHGYVKSRPEGVIGFYDAISVDHTPRVRNEKRWVVHEAKNGSL